MLNNICVMGRLVADPELRKTTNGVSTTTFTIACERSIAGKDGKRATDFFDIVCWRQTAEFACRYFRKGQLIAVNGTLQTRTYQDKQGNNRKVFEIVADNLHFAEGKKDTGHTVATDEIADDIPASDGFAPIPDEPDLPF